MLIKLTKGKYAIVDDEDYPYLSRFKWKATEVASNYWIATMNICTPDAKNPIGVCMHHFVFTIRQGYGAHHINKDTLDYRKKNLKEVTHGQAIHYSTKRKNTTSLYKGVNWHTKSKKWRAEIKKDGE